MKKKDLANGLLLAVAGISILSEVLGFIDTRSAMISLGITLLLVGIHYVAHGMSWCGCEKGLKKR